MRESIASAPGKVNLLLRSGTPSEDGYHPLLTVFEAVSLREIVVARTRRAPGTQVRTFVYEQVPGQVNDYRLNRAATDSIAKLPEESHLAVRAARALAPLVAAKWGPSAAGLELTVHKTLPVAGGMAGGSADGAAALVAVNDLWELGLNAEQLETLGRTLGADVPACLRGGWAVGVGRGDILTSLPQADTGEKHWWAFAFSRRGLSTPEVFARFDELRLGTDFDQNPKTIMEDPAPYTGALVPQNLVNDLAPVALQLLPELENAGRVATENGALAWTISGSGPTVAALAGTREVAEKIVAAWRNSESLSPHLAGSAVGSGPDRGAHTQKHLPSWVEAAR